jgi:dienelactone hydrolase
MDTLASRWARLEPHAQWVGPDDDLARPTALLFHGCGGLRAHLPLYAEAVRAAGWRACIVDSYGPREWSRTFALTMVCSGAVLRGHERGGDILAAIHGVSQRADVDADQLAVAGWSHGGWGIMEMLAAPRRRTGDLGLADSGAASLDGVRGSFLAYPYVGFLALARARPWRHKPVTEVVIARRDHLTTVGNAERIFAGHQKDGATVTSWIADGTHSFDEPTGTPPMRHDPALSEESVARFGAFLARLSAPRP